MTPNKLYPGDCPLSDALLFLLQACMESESLKDAELATFLCQSPETVHTNFKRIAEALGTHERSAAVLLACKRGWISFPTPPRVNQMMLNNCN